jgi:NTP pyrophosphatase (non-canonical NTP hydrolase)
MSDREAFKKVASGLGYSFVLNESGSYNSPFTESAYLVFLSTVEHCKQGEPVAWMAYQGTFQMVADTKDKLPKGCQESAIPLFTHAMPESDDLNSLAARQSEWLKSMGWWKDKTHLESLMLVVSECGEAANEVRGLQPTDKFQTELADIILRTLGLAAENGIDIQQAVLGKMAKNLELQPNPDRLK